MTEINEGDVVEVQVHQTSYDGSRSILHYKLRQYDTIHGIVTGTSGDSVTIDEIEEAPGIRNQTILNLDSVSTKKKTCGNCNSSKVYHDTKEQWYCPWCDV